MYSGNLCAALPDGTSERCVDYTPEGLAMIQGPDANVDHNTKTEDEMLTGTITMSSTSAKPDAESDEAKVTKQVK